jgi:predicted nucleic acid-binding protein
MGSSFSCDQVLFSISLKKKKEKFILPDFFVGTHAAVVGIPLLTRDVACYRTYFSNLKIITPGTNKNKGDSSIF